MKYLLFVLLLFPLSALAQEKAWNETAFHQQWLTDFNKAQRKAKRGEKEIILYFSGSDWCGPCKKLKQEVFARDTFLHYANKHWVLVYLDYPRYTKQDARQKAHNARIKAQYNAIGQFPMVALLNAQGQVLGHTGYVGYPAPRYIAHLKEISQRARQRNQSSNK